jgi:hypothetical protein
LEFAPRGMAAPEARFANKPMRHAYSPSVG